MAPDGAGWRWKLDSPAAAASWGGPGLSLLRRTDDVAAVRSPSVVTLIDIRTSRSGRFRNFTDLDCRRP
jgi:hypothetical protein